MAYANREDQAAAARRHYERNTEAMKLRARAYRKACIERNRNHVVALKTEAVCADCRIDYPFYVLQFDHIGDNKIDHVAKMVSQGVPFSTLENEISKCEIVCANCHAIRTP